MDYTIIIKDGKAESRGIKIMKLRKLFAPLLALAMLASCAGPKMTWDDCIKDGEK